MAIVRCDIHPLDMSRCTNNYVIIVEPIGYPETAVICGRPGCEKPGRVWLTDKEINQFAEGKRIFSISNHATKIKLSDIESPIPYHQLNL